MGSEIRIDTPLKQIRIRSYGPYFCAYYYGRMTDRTDGPWSKIIKRMNLPRRPGQNTQVTFVTDTNTDVTDPNKDVIDPNKDVTDTNKDVTDPNKDVTDSNRDITDTNTENFGF